MSRPSRFGVLAERPFRLLWSAQTLSSAGDALIPVAAVFAVLDVSGSASGVGLVLAARLIPRMLLTLAGGVWADRLPRQWVMVGSDVVRGGAHALTAVLLLTGTAQLWHLVILSAVYGAGAAFFNPAATGIVPETVPQERLQEANALILLSRNAIGVVGPALSGIAVAAAGPGWVFAADAVTFAGGAVFLLLLPLARSPRASRPNFVRALTDGWRLLTGRTWIWASIVNFAVWNLAIAPFYVLGPVVADSELGGAKAWGVVMTGVAVGSVAGSAVALRFRPRRPLLVAYVLVATSALQPALLIPPFPTVAIAAAAAVGLAGVALANTLWYTVLQEHVAREAVSRVSAYEWLGSYVFMPLGYVLAGPLAAWIGIRETLAGSAVLLVVSTIAVACSASVRGMRRVEAQAGTVPV